MEVYASRTTGVGGVIKEAVEDFVVEEVLVDSSKASINGEVPKRVLGSSASKQRFLLCMVVKRNWDTFIATKNIAKALSIDQCRVQFAGIKDAKAVTAQHITLEGVSMDEAAKISVKDIQVSPIGYIRERLSLFYLLGNNFAITIKHAQGSEATINDNISQTIRELEAVGGAPNFFGHQRFGTTRPITHLVGKALVNGDFEGATMLFLAKPSPYEHPTSRQARQTLQDTHDFKEAQANFPRQLRFERMMLNHLADNPTDYVGAFQKLPPKLQALFVQAHQSYLFNRFLSARIQEKIPLNETVEGDYVVGVERSGLPLTTVAKVVTQQNLAEVNAQVQLGKLRVALPIFGVKQKLSQGIMGKMQEEVLTQEGISTENKHFNELSRVGGKGGLRAALSPIKDFKLQQVFANSEGTGPQAKVSFMLLRGCYATVVLRELMKPSDPVAAGF